MIVKPKKLKNNTYKIISSYLEGGGFSIKFFDPYEKTEDDKEAYIVYLDYLNNEIETENIEYNKMKKEERGEELKKPIYFTKNIVCEQFTNEDVDIDKNGVWRIKK